jgi:hypothetical protein
MAEEVSMPRNRHGHAPAIVLAISLACVPLPGQNYPPAQYPPSTYPPNTYPPGQYPPGQYPPNTTRLPGGIGIPVPEIKLPKRKEKPEKAESKNPEKAPKNDKELTIRLVSVDGTLRRLGEKELLLETSAKGVLQFRLLAKTLFRGTDGQPVRDSLLKPGDRLRIEVNPDDEETALRVVVLRNGTPAERASASQPVDPASVKVPEALGPPPSESSEKEPAGNEPSEVEQRPKLQRRSGPAAGVPQAEPPVQTAGGNWPAEGKVAVGDESIFFGKVEPAIAGARDAAGAFSDTLPNFLVQQLTTRYMSTTVPPQWRALDIVEAEVACVNGIEEYRNISINGKASKRPIEKTGAWSTGEFVTTLQDILSPMTDAAFVKRGEERVANRMALVYVLNVRQSNSHWTVIANEQSYRPAYRGAIWIDKETHRVLRIEQESLSLPAGFPFDKAETTLEYDFVRIEKEMHLLPVRSENLTCQRGTSICSRNEINFRKLP